MPPKRKALESADPNAKQASTTNKKAKPEASTKTATSDDSETALRKEALEKMIKKRESRWAKVSGSKNWDADYLHKTVGNKSAYAYEFLCVCNPFTKSDDDDDSGGDEEAEEASSCEERRPQVSSTCNKGKTCPCGKSAASFPSHTCMVSRAGLLRNNMAQGMLNLRSPNAFGVFSFNDHFFYGALEVVQNMMLDFHDAYQNNEWRQMWAIVEGTALLLLVGGGDMMYMADDGERIEQTAVQIARMMLTALTVLEHNDKLTPDSEVENVGWVMNLYQDLLEQMQDSGLLEDEERDLKRYKFQGSSLLLYLYSYATRCGLNVPGLTDKPLGDSPVLMPKMNAKDPWSWTSSFNAYKKEGHIGGDHLDITTWSAAERKKASYDGKDPFPKDAMKKLKEGLVLALG